MALERSPSDKHLRRLVGEFSPGKCRELAIELGLSVHEWENFEYQFQFQIPDDLKFVAIRSCREKSRNFTFRMLVRVLEKLELSQHLLCKVRMFHVFPYFDENLICDITLVKKFKKLKAKHDLKNKRVSVIIVGVHSGHTILKGFPQYSCFYREENP